MRDPTEAGPGVPIPRRHIALFFCALWLALAWIGGEYVARTSFEVEGQRVHTLWDDAMISMQYAKNLSAGYGLVWNAGGERVQGITNLGMARIMAGVHLFPVGPFKVSLLIQMLNLVMLGATLVLVWYVARSSGRNWPLAALNGRPKSHFEVRFWAPWCVMPLPRLS